MEPEQQTPVFQDHWSDVKLNQIVSEKQEIFGGRLEEQQESEYKTFINNFKQYEEDLAKLGECEELRDHGGIGVLFDVSRLREQFADEYWKKFPKKKVHDSDDMDIFAWLGDPSFTINTEEEGEG